KRGQATSDCNGLSRTPRRQRAKDFVGVEALSDQVAKQSLELPIVSDPAAAFEPPVECRGEERLLVNLLERFIDRLTGCGSRDAGLLNLLHDAPLAATLHGHLGSRNRARHTSIVDRAVRLEAFDGGLDLGLVIAPARQTLTYLRFRQFSTGEHSQSGHAG